MKRSSRTVRRVLWLSATVLAAAVVGVTTSVLAAQPGPRASSDQIGPGYPPPKGIYAPFTNCPILNPLMAEGLSGTPTACIAGDVTSGTITIGTITTQVVYPVNAQFGIYSPPNSSPDEWSGGTLPPPAGVSAELATQADLIPDSLTTALGCPSKNKTVERLCSEAEYYGGSYNQVWALAEEALPVTNFDIFSWTQPIMIQLINPLLGSDCFIGTPDNPITINPQLTGTLFEEVDPHPKAHPDTVVVGLSDAVATDDTFSAPEVTGCGPGGMADVAVEYQLDSFAGLPSPSGDNSLTLGGNFYIADCYNGSHQAHILYEALLASQKEYKGGREAGEARPLAAATLRGSFGIK
jgi:hypothetical protein